MQLVGQTDGVSYITKVTAANELVVALSGAVVLGTGSAEIGKLAANADVNIGEVSVNELPAVTFDTDALAKIGDVTTEVAKLTALIDTARLKVSGNFTNATVTTVICDDMIMKHTDDAAADVGSLLAAHWDALAAAGDSGNVWYSVPTVKYATTGAPSTDSTSGIVETCSSYMIYGSIEMATSGSTWPILSLEGRLEGGVLDTNFIPLLENQIPLVGDSGSAVKYFSITVQNNIKAFRIKVLRKDDTELHALNIYQSITR